MEFEFLSFYVDIMPPWRGHGRPRRVPMDEEDASAPHTPLPQCDPSILLEFSILFIPQAGLYPPMTFEAFQAFTIYWYAQTQTQTQA